MTNTEIRIAAQQIYRQLVIATYNDAYGEDDGSMNILTSRMIKAVEWAKENGEYDALKHICAGMYRDPMSGMMGFADECFATIFE